MKIVYLELTSFWCGRHVHADLRCSDGEHKMLFDNLTAKEALRRNKEERKQGGYRWKPGDVSAGFESEARARAVAKKVWREHFPDAELLVVGSSHVIEPHEPLDGTHPIKLRKLQNLWKRFEPLIDEESWEAREPLGDEWRELTR